jgi:nicotinamide riboside transporter PnuC
MGVIIREGLLYLDGCWALSVFNFIYCVVCFEDNWTKKLVSVLYLNLCENICFNLYFKKETQEEKKEVKKETSEAKEEPKPTQEKGVV